MLTRDWGWLVRQMSRGPCGIERAMDAADTKDPPDPACVDLRVRPGGGRRRRRPRTFEMRTAAVQQPEVDGRWPCRGCTMNRQRRRRKHSARARPRHPEAP